MNNLPATLRQLADQIEAQELQDGTAFQVQAQPGKLTMHHRPDDNWSPPSDFAPQSAGYFDNGVWTPGYLITFDL